MGHVVMWRQTGPWRRDEQSSGLEEIASGLASGLEELASGLVSELGELASGLEWLPRPGNVSEPRESADLFLWYPGFERGVSAGSH